MTNINILEVTEDELLQITGGGFGGLQGPDQGPIMCLNGGIASNIWWGGGGSIGCGPILWQPIGVD